MTEEQWLNWSTYPGGVAEMFRGKVGARKVRLFAVACCRRIAHLLPDDQRCRRGIEVAERYADRLATREELFRGHADAEAACPGRPGAYRTCGRAAAGEAARAVSTATHPTSRTYAAGVVGCAAGAARYASFPRKAPASAAYRPPTREPGFVAGRAEHAAQCHLLRDIYGNPFRPPPAIARALLAWNGGTIPKLARGIYEERAFERLPVLADALEEAGCTSEDILAHCRGPGTHARGCWALDLLRGRQ
jgi:hypothetical protein